MSEFSKKFMKWCGENSDLFLETGTFKGVTTELASKHFSDVRSIEIDENNYKYSKQKLKEKNNISLYFGDVLNQLPGILSKVKDQKITFWLDAHPMDPEVDAACPLLTELDMINEHSDRDDHIILIDDLQRCFKSDGDYPKVEELEAKLKIINPNYVISQLPFKSWKIPKGDPTILCATTEELKFPDSFYVNPLSFMDKYLRVLKLKE